MTRKIGLYFLALPIGVAMLLSPFAILSWVTWILLHNIDPEFVPQPWPEP
jgi:hypothetical protein